MKHSFTDKRVPKCNFGTRGKVNAVGAAGMSDWSNAAQLMVV